MKRIKRETLAHNILIKEGKKDIMAEIAYFKDYTLHKWAYNYMFPEYFEPVRIPDINSSPTAMCTLRMKKTTKANKDGEFTFVFNPKGVLHKVEDAVAIPIASWYSGSGYNKKIKNIVNNVLEAGSDYNKVSGLAVACDDRRIVSGFAAITFFIKPGKIAIRKVTIEGVDSIINTNSDHSYDKIVLPGHRFITRYRTHELKDTKLTSSVTSIATVMFCYGLPANASLEVEMNLTFEYTPKLANNDIFRALPPDASEGELARNISKIEHLSTLIDKYEYTPLFNPMANPEFFEVTENHGGLLLPNRENPEEIAMFRYASENHIVAELVNGNGNGNGNGD